MVFGLCLLCLCPRLRLHLGQGRLGLPGVEPGHLGQRGAGWRLRWRAVEGLAGQPGGTSVRRAEEAGHRGAGELSKNTKIFLKPESLQFTKKNGIYIVFRPLNHFHNAAVSLNHNLPWPKPGIGSHLWLEIRRDCAQHAGSKR